MRKYSHMRPCVARHVIAIVLVAAASALAAEGPYKSQIPIVNAQKLPATPISCERHPLGIANDYKPWLAQLKNGDLLAVAFCFGPVAGVDGYVERAIFWRSKDGGKTWGPREERIDIQGREFGLTALSDGTLLMTCHWLARDAFNPTKHTHSKIFRSVDDGKTWSETTIGPAGFPDGAATIADWMAFEMPDPKQPNRMLTCVGVSIHSAGEQGPEYARIWRSTDSGKTWDRSLHPDTDKWVDVDGFFSQTVTFRTLSGRLLHPVRVDRTGPHWHIAGTPERLKTERGDNGDRMMLWESLDNGRTFRRTTRGGIFGTYGEMYPRFLQLDDKRILLTFTVRSNSTDGHPLGLRAIISYDEGHTWDFKHDRMVLSLVNHAHSGGGFGNTIQLKDETLVSIYSYRAEDEKTYIETVRWRHPE